MTPLIGITRCNRLNDYVSAIENEGGRVRVLDGARSPEEALGEVDGIVLTGGADVDPAHYGETPHPATVIDSARDAFELPLARAALTRNLPVLAICRGVQVLNVAAGGSLVQDIPSEIESRLSHSIESPADAVAHDVRIDATSCLAAAMSLGSRATLPVNSRHHQAVGRVADGFRVSATSADGVIEAIERPDAHFCVGVQWHPENFWRTGEFRSLFAAFLAACANR